MKYVVLLLVFILGKTSCLNAASPQHIQKLKMVEKLYLERMYKNEKFIPYMIGGGGVSAICNFAYGFDIKEVVDLKRARTLFFEAYDDLESIVNSSKEARPFYVKYPMDGRNLEISLSFIDKDDSIAYLFNRGSKIRYYKKNEEGNYRLLFKESMDEARAGLE